MQTYIMKSFIILVLIVQCSFSKDLKDILDDGYIRVGVKYDYKPFGFINNDGRLDGFDIDLIKIMMNKLELRVQFIEVNSINKERMLLNDNLDILFAGMIEDKQSNKNIIFTKPYYLDEQVILLNSKNSVNSLKEMNNMHVGSLKGTNYLNNLLKIQPNVITISFSQYPQLTKALSFNNIDAVTAGSTWAKEQVESHQNEFRILSDVICTIRYSIALKKNNENLKEKLNSLFTEITKDNTYEKIYKKWFK
ncbi:ABC transporter substrate-binding protein [Arcobacter sp. F2176]|uniref:substrate-binding periplasmic protein n=1 Tax=unclassified Arcobacter TaxID=2593671 RepID=UPI00100BFB79|nr:transporter substrate-binding domain-containing protein [Arcobacter sp. F2176]